MLKPKNLLNRRLKPLERPRARIALIPDHDSAPLRGRHRTGSAVR